jgi:hypothetical protein
MLVALGGAPTTEPSNLDQRWGFSCLLALTAVAANAPELLPLASTDSGGVSTPDDLDLPARLLLLLSTLSAGCLLRP